MKVSAVLLRWYKSFNINYLGYDERQPGIVQRPWNGLGYDSESSYQFIEIPLRPDITTIVGANESGKSHLLSSLRKVIHGEGIPEFDGTASKFNVTDLCHYASVRNKNANVWPNIGVTFCDVTPNEVSQLIQASGATGPPTCSRVTLILAHEDKKREAVLYFDENEPVDLNEAQLKKVRKLLPKVEFIRSNIPLAGELPINDLLANSKKTENRYVSFELVQEAVDLIATSSFSKESKPSEELANKANELKTKISNFRNRKSTSDSHILESQLFRDVLGIEDSAIELLAKISPKDRGFAEGLVATWNQELDRKLNLQRFWEQDDQFSLSLDFKGGWFYFEIRDKTGSVYTFRERSSGLRFFLSYYIQAKSIEARSGDDSCIILMDEPDSFLSISGQKNLLAVFESLVSQTLGNPNLQLIYTTHSPFLINPNYPHRIRLVKKGDAEEGSQHIPESRLRRYEPVRSALGIDCAQTLFMGEANILLEGPSDQFLIIELIRFFAQLRKTTPILDLSSTVVMSAESAPGVEKILDASKWGDEKIPATVVLFDSDGEGILQKNRVTGNEKLAKLIEEKYVVLIGDEVSTTSSQNIVTTEDLIPSDVFGLSVYQYIQKWYPQKYEENQNKIHEKITAADFGINGNAADTQSIFSELIFDNPKRDYDKMGIMHTVIEQLEETAIESSSSPHLAEIEARLSPLLKCLRKKVAESRHDSNKESARQSIIRLSKDFFKRFKSAAEAFEIGIHLERIEKETKEIGDDFASLNKILDYLIKEVKELLTIGDVLIEKEEWHRWSSLLHAILKNPISPDIEIKNDRAEPANLWKPTKVKKVADEVEDDEVEDDEVEDDEVEDDEVEDDEVEDDEVEDDAEEDDSDIKEQSPDSSK